MVKGKYTSPSTDGALKAIAVVLTLGGLIHVANHTAASFNPAVTVGLTSFQNFVLPNNTEGYLTHYTWAYFFGPLVGGALSGVFSLGHKQLFEPEPVKAKGIPAAQNEEEEGLVTATV